MLHTRMSHSIKAQRGRSLTYTPIIRSSGRVLNDITLSIQAGEKVGICGRTGR